MPSWAPGTLVLASASAARRCSQCAASTRGAAAVDGVLLDPVDHPAVVVEPLRGRAEQDEHVRGVRVEHQLGRDAALAQRGVPLLGLADRAGQVVRAVQHEGRGARPRPTLVSGDIAAYCSGCSHGVPPSS